MTLSIAKLGDAGSAFAYYSERDDYYISKHGSAEWFGRGAKAAGLAGDVDKSDFHDVLAGQIKGKQVGNPDKRTPGWDMTFSAGKGASVAAFVNKDERVTDAWHASVRDAMAYAEQVAATTRQRDGEGRYVWKDTHNLTAALVLHSTSRDGDPQLHIHAVAANVTLDPETGEWRSLDSRVLYAARREIENVQANSFAQRLQALGYDVDWHVRANGSVAVDIADVPQGEKDLFSSRRKEIEAALIAKGIDPATASREARQAATLDTRSPKVHESGEVLHARWETQAKAAGFEVGARPEPASLPTPEQRATAAAEAVKTAAESIGERETRFTPRQLLAEAVTYSQGRASLPDLEAAIGAAHERGELLDRQVNVRGHDGAIERQDGYTTPAAATVETDMLARASTLANRPANLSVQPADVDRIIGDREVANGHKFTREQRDAVEAVLSGRDGSLAVIQGYAGTAKTTSVHAAIADAAREQGIRVRAIAPTHSAANTLAETLGCEYQTVASINAKMLDRDARKEVWIVDEAGMVSAKDMRDLLRKADLSGAQVILSGDTKQIGSVGAGAAYQQLQDANPERTSKLTDIKRQTSAQLKQAVYDSLADDFDSALSKVDTQEIKDRETAITAIADAYMRDTAAGKSTLVVTLSNADRRDVNAAIQDRRVAAGQVRDVHEITTYTQASKTDAEARDAARYQPGEVLEAGRDFKRGGPRKGELLTVTGTDGKRVTVRRADGTEWKFNPKKVTALQSLEKAQTRIGAGDLLVAKGNIAARYVDDPGRAVTIRNGATLTIDSIDEHGHMLARDKRGRQLEIDASRGVKADLGYAQTANSAQGRTVDSAVVWMRSNQRNLADRQHAYVTMSRARSHATVVTDDKTRLAETLSKSQRGKQMALDRNDPDGAHDRKQVAGQDHNATAKAKAAKPTAQKIQARAAAKAFAASSGKAISAATRKYGKEQWTGVTKAAHVFAKAARHEFKRAGKGIVGDMRHAAYKFRRDAGWAIGRLNQGDVIGFAGGMAGAAALAPLRAGGVAIKAGARVGYAAAKASTKAAWTLSGRTLRAIGRAGQVAGHRTLATLEAVGAASGTDRGLRIAQRAHDIRHAINQHRDTVFAKRDREWLTKGAKSLDEMDRDGAKTEASITERTDAKLDVGVVGKAFESKRARAGRLAIERMRAGREQARRNINASLEAAFQREIERESRNSHVSAAEARERVGQRVAADRMGLPGGRTAEAVMRFAGKTADAIAAPLTKLRDEMRARTAAVKAKQYVGLDKIGEVIDGKPQSDVQQKATQRDGEHEADGKATAKPEVVTAGEAPEREAMERDAEHGMEMR